MPKHIKPEIKAEALRLRVEEGLGSTTIARRLGIGVWTAAQIAKKHPLSQTERFRSAIKNLQLGRMELATKEGHRYNGGIEWTAEEHETLRIVWPVLPSDKVMEALPGRTWDTIQAMASKHKIRRSRSVSATGSKDTHPIFRRLREIRERQGLTRQQMAEKAGFHPVRFAQLELGRARPSWFALLCWVEALGCELEVKERLHERRRR